jgi:serine/threonine protein kinase
MGDHVASGGFGCVYRASWNGCLVAVKRLFDPLITDELRAEFANEVRVLSRLRHPNIVQFLACCSKPPHLCIVTEFMARGSLYHVLYSSAVEMPRERQNTIIKQLAAALAYLHSIDIVHNDIKAPNVLVRTSCVRVGRRLALFICVAYHCYCEFQFNVLLRARISWFGPTWLQVDEHFKTKLCDFGLARPVNLLGQMRAAGGTPNYIAPVRSSLCMFFVNTFPRGWTHFCDSL